ncbi:MAG: hypothetical protein GEV11_23665 [Streptosporangiales bacterium]|nr:hypothetical protein [Streptosporangiales bacterium]
MTDEPGLEDAMGGLSRLYAVEFDSLAQRHLADRVRTPLGDDPLSAFVAILRLSGLLAETVVLTDSSVFDGCLFHRLGPARLLQLAGRAQPGGMGLSYPFEILSRAPNLEQSLLHAVRDPDEAPDGRLRMYEFSALDVPEPERVRLGERLHLVKPRELDKRVAKHGVTEGIAQLLIECCDAPTLPVSRMQSGWEEWIRQDRAGRLNVKVWPQMGKYGDDQAFAWDPVTAMHADLKTEVGRIGLDWVFENRHLRRTEIRAFLRSLLPYDAPDLSADREIIEFWYNACYVRALAYAQGAELIEFVLGDPGTIQSRRLLRRRGAAPGGGESRRVLLPPSLLRQLGTMPRAVYETVLYRNRDAVLSWRRHGDKRSMRRIAYGLLDAVEQPNPKSGRRIAMNSALVVLAAVIVELFDTLPLWAKAPLVAGAALAASWEQLGTEIRLNGQLGAVIDVRKQD